MKPEKQGKRMGKSKRRMAQWACEWRAIGEGADGTDRHCAKAGQKWAKSEKGESHPRLCAPPTRTAEQISVAGVCSPNAAARRGERDSAAPLHLWKSDEGGYAG